MKRTHLTLIVIYFIITLYFAVFNWDMFTVFLNINLGFTMLNVPLIIVLFLLGLVFLLIQWGFVNVNNLKFERDMARKDNEITKLKAAQYDTQKTKIHDNSMSLKELHSKLNKVMVKLDVKAEEKTKALKKAEKFETEERINQQENESTWQGQ